MKIKQIIDYFCQDEVETIQNIDKDIFRAYDIRGVFEKNLFDYDAYQIAKAFGKVLSDKKKYNCVLAYDVRNSSLKLAKQFIRGLVDSGISVYNIGCVPTPVLYFYTLQHDAGVMITGSHNPKEYNGFKLHIKDEDFLSDDIQNLKKIIDEKDFVKETCDFTDLNNKNKSKNSINENDSNEKNKQTIQTQDINNLNHDDSHLKHNVNYISKHVYVNSLVNNIKHNINDDEDKNACKEHKGKEIVINNVLKTYIKSVIAKFSFGGNLKILWDTGNGTCGEVIRLLTQFIPCVHDILFERADGNFPSRQPDPVNEKNLNVLKQNIVENGFDIGIAFDCDGDRISVINRFGKFIPMDVLFSVFSKEIINKSNNNKIICDLRFSQFIVNEIKASGGEIIYTKPGHCIVKSELKKHDAVFAGEMSGHFFFNEGWFGFDDAIYAALKLIEIIGKNPDLLNEFPDIFATNEIRYNCGDQDKFKIINQIKNTIDDYFDIQEKIEIDGIKVKLLKGNFLIRASNTEDIISFRVEGNSYQEFEDIKYSLSIYLKKFINIDITF